MHISEKLKEYLSDSKNVCESNIIITDLENIEFVNLLNGNTQNITLNNKLSDEILDLIKILNDNLYFSKFYEK